MSTKPLTSDQIIERFKQVHGDNYNYSNVCYVNMKTKVLITCKDHGNFLQKPESHVNGSGCLKCFNASKVKPFASILLDFKKVHNDQYDYSNVCYVNTDTKVSIICHTHGEFLQRPYSHIAGKGCPKCVISRQPKKIDDIMSSIQQIHGDRYDYSKVAYKSYHEKIIITCHKHGDFEQSFRSHHRGSGCPKCKASKGENKIRLFLDNNAISYIEQYHLCKNPETNCNLRVDFYLPLLNTVLEYDGMQHFKPVDRFGGEKCFDNLVKRDTIKNAFCVDNNITLIRIGYKDFKNTESILAKRIIR